MKDNIFLDTNILIYLFSNDILKKEISKELLRKKPNISIQVCNEVSNILMKKYKFSPQEVKNILKEILKNTTLNQIDNNTIFDALDIKDRYNFSYYDSLILSSAKNLDCNILYSENMQNNQQIDNLTIINPFKN
jgi:predicted nucleic acid-binding protein